MERESIPFCVASINIPKLELPRHKYQNTLLHDSNKIEMMQVLMRYHRHAVAELLPTIQPTQQAIAQ